MTDDHEKALEAAARALTPVLHGSQEDEWGGDLPPVEFDDLSPDWRTAHIEYARACVAAYLAAREAAGWVMVPVEATQEMTKAAAAAMSPGHRPDRWVSCSEKHAIRYRAMIAARPRGEG
jgi:hypothetical protein